MDEDQLNDLRTKIIADVKPLTLQDMPDGKPGFDMLMQLIRFGDASADVYNKAYDIAKALDDPKERLSSLMTLLNEIDFDLSHRPAKTQA